MIQTKYVISSLLVLLLAGCIGADRSTRPLDDVEGLVIHHEWRKIYNFQIQGTERIRQHVGFLDRRFSEENPAGTQFVLDRTHEMQGYVLPHGAAYAYVPDSENDKALGSSDLDNGIKRILKLTGQLVIEPVDAESTGSANSAGR